MFTFSKDDVKSMADNFSEIVKLCRVEEEAQVSRATQAEEDALEMQVRSSNMVRAGESLMKLVSDLKIYLILNDFPNVNEAISSNSSMFKEMQVGEISNKCSQFIRLFRPPAIVISLPSEMTWQRICLN